MANSVQNPDNNYIEKTANATITSLLRDLFQTKNLNLGENQTTSSQDWGTDYYIEVLNKETIRELLFLIQCKGTNKAIKIKKDGSFSFTMSIRHANYFYYQLSEPLMFMVCDIRTKNVYWYSVQIDHQIESKIISQINSNKESLQVNIPQLNLLSEENFDRFLTELEESRKAQIHKQKIKISSNGNYNYITKSLNNLNIVDTIDQILNHFEGINVFPPFIINKLFSLLGKNTSLHGEILTTDNEILFDFFENLEIKGSKLFIKNKKASYSSVADLQEKLHRILSFFQINTITHIDWRGPAEKDKIRICIHDLYISNDCGCERCTYKKLNLHKTIDLLGLENKSATPEEKLKKAYTYFLINEPEKSYWEYKKLLSEISISKKPGIYIIAKYNLLQLKTLINNYVFSSSRNEILKELENENFMLDEILMPEHYLDLFKIIKENKLIPDSVLKIDNTLTDIRKMWESDQLGGSSNNNFDRTLIIDFLRSYDFIEYNHLIYFQYREFEMLVNKTLEGIFALYSVKNPNSSRYEHFGYTILDMWLFHADPKHVRNLMGKYRLLDLQIEFKETVFDRLSMYINNLIDSSEIIKERFDQKNFSHNEKISRIIQNYLLIIGVIKIEDDQRNYLFGKYLALVKNLNHWYFKSFEYLSAFLNYAENISSENLTEIIKLLIADDRYNYDTFLQSVNIYANRFENGKSLENELKKVFSIKKFDPKDFYTNQKYSNLVSLIPKLTKPTQNAIKKNIENKLKSDFSNNLYFVFTINGILDYDELLLKKYIDATPDYTSAMSGNELLGGRKETKNYHLNKVISLHFKFNLEFNDEVRFLSSKAVDKDYYDWLMNMNGFDYTKFNLYWILYNRSKFYLKAFKENSILMRHIAQGLKKNYIEGVADLYINELL